MGSVAPQQLAVKFYGISSEIFDRGAVVNSFPIDFELTNLSPFHRTHGLAHVTSCPHPRSSVQGVAHLSLPSPPHTIPQPPLIFWVNGLDPTKST